MSRLRFVLDTNVLVSALRSKRGASFELVVQRMDDARIELQVSNTLMLEYEEVLHRERPALGVSEAEIDEMLDGLLAAAARREIHYSWRPASTDADYDFLFDLAVAASAHYVVSFNADDLRGLAAHGIEVVTPGKFLHIVRQLPP